MKLKSKYTALAGLVFLAACGSGAVGLGNISSLGTDFVRMFAAAPNSEPVDAQSVNIAAISYTTDPFNP